MDVFLLMECVLLTGLVLYSNTYRSPRESRQTGMVILWFLLGQMLITALVLFVAGV